MIVTLEIARQHRTSHPNCRRATSPRPDIATAPEARTAAPTPSGDAARDREVALAQQARTQRLVAVSTTAGARRLLASTCGPGRCRPWPRRSAMRRSRVAAPDTPDRTITP